MYTTKMPKVIVYKLTTASGWEQLYDSLIHLPEKIGIAPWHSMKKEDVLREAQQRGLLLDMLPEFVNGIEKIKSTKSYFAKKNKPYPFPKIVSTEWNTACAVEFPWKKAEHYVILPPKEAFLFLIYSRNEMLIPDKAQKAFQTVRVGFAGAGVGSSLLEGVVKAGVQDIVVADGGDISFHDLNRLPSPTVTSIGENHAMNVAKRALEANPFLTINCIPKNLGVKETETTYSIDAFLDQVDIVFEEVDNLTIKLVIREKAKEKCIPVIMATDVGFGTIIEFQKGDPKAPVFPLLSEKNKQDLKEDKSMSLSEKTAIAIKMVGEEATYWQTGIQKGLTFWPQTGAAADASKAKAIETLVKWIMGETIPQKQVFL